MKYNTELLLQSPLVEELKDHLYRHNTEHHTRYNLSNLPEENLQQISKIPTFILTALNYPLLVDTIKTQAHANSETVLLHLNKIVETEIQKAQDELSFWLVDVPLTLFQPVLDHLYAIGADIVSIDPKFKTHLNKANWLSRLKIQDTSDYLEALKAIQFAA